jgi:hypothetical protein
MRWRERNKTAQFCNDLVIDQHRHKVRAAAVNDAMSGGSEWIVGEPLLQPAEDRCQCFFMRGTSMKILGDQRTARTVFSDKMNPVADALASALAKQIVPFRPPTHREEGELDARGTCIQDQNRIAHDRTSCW